MCHNGIYKLKTILKGACILLKKHEYNKLCRYLLPDQPPYQQLINLCVCLHDVYVKYIYKVLRWSEYHKIPVGSEGIINWNEIESDDFKLRGKLCVSRLGPYTGKGRPIVDWIQWVDDTGKLFWKPKLKVRFWKSFHQISHCQDLHGITFVDLVTYHRNTFQTLFLK
jgi:hypothetical protein